MFIRPTTAFTSYRNADPLAVVVTSEVVIEYTVVPYIQIPPNLMRNSHLAVDITLSGILRGS